MKGGATRWGVGGVLGKKSGGKLKIGGDGGEGTHWGDWWVSGNHKGANCATQRKNVC